MSPENEDKRPQTEEAKEEVKQHVKVQMDDFKRTHIRDFLFFDTLLTPKIITLVYWLLVIGSVVEGLLSLLKGEIIRGPGIIIFGIVLSRVACELMIVLFKMNDALQEMRKK